MGEVYLAEDTNLRRKVALKILSADLTRSDERLRRFEQEAYAASALSHPNILVVYEIGCEGSTHFIATEFIEGRTLRQRITRGGMSIRDALDVAIQAAGALAAAHKAGILHRDLKPENLMLREDGYIKLLDFGLAKLIEPPAGASGAQPPTAGVSTELGAVMGTINYMSPEQVRAKEVDARTDLFSLGVVIYEMVTGHRPFEGESSGDVMASILTRDPAPLARFAPETPAELERIVDRALRKDREERYQSARDLFLDLKTLRQDLEVDARLQRWGPQDSAGPAFRTGGLAAVSPAAGQPAGETGVPAAARAVSSAQYIVSEIRRRKRGLGLVGAGLIAGVLVGVFALHKLLHRNERPASSQAMRTIPLTNTGKAQLAAISPEAKYVAYVQGDGAQQSLWIRQVSTAGTVNILPSAEAQYWGVAFSPDSNFIYYVRAEKEDPRTGVLSQVPILGGGSRKLLEDVSSPITLAPDGKRLAFLRVSRGRGEMALMVANLDGTGERKLTTLRAGGFLPEHGPSWSPDGLRIALADTRVDADTTYSALAEVLVDEGTKRDISPRRFFHPQQLAWLSDGSGLLFVGQDRGTAFAPQIWHVSYPHGEARRITQQLDNYSSISLSRDSTALVAAQWRPVSSIWVAPLESAASGSATSATQIQSQIGGIEGKYGLSWMPNNRIAYSSNVSGNWVILVSDVDGSNQKQLTFDPSGDYDPSVTPDGRYLVFASNRGGGRSIWRMDLDGGNVKQITQGTMDWLPHCSADGKWVVYSSVASGKRTIWKVGTDGGRPAQLTDKLSNQPAFSADGKFVACFYSDERRNSRMKIAILPSAGGPPSKLLDLSPSAETLISSIRWMPDGRAVAYVDTTGGVSNIWGQPLSGGPPKQLTHFTSDRILKFDISPDGQRIACARGGNSSDAVLISDFR